MDVEKKNIHQKSQKIINKVISYCKSEAENGVPSCLISRPMERASEMTGVSVRTLYRIKKKACCPVNKKPRKKRKGKHDLDDFDKCVVRRTVANIYGIRKIFLSVENIRKELRDSINFTGSKTTLRRILKEMGFKWKKCKPNRKILMERTDIVSWRVSYLQKIKKYRENSRPIVYMDKTFVPTSHHVPKSWQCDNIALKVPIGKGKRYIIVHAGTKDGFISNAHDVSKGKNSSSDYHTDMNREKFDKWVNDNLLPNLPTNSVIVLDNAPYHTVQEDRCPTMATKKADIIAWMTKQGIAVPQNKPIKATLIEICKQHKPRPSYRIDGILKRHGHETLRLPPYHADLNVI